MAIPVWTVGQVLTANDVDEWFRPRAVAYKSVATSRTSTTLADDTDLSLSLANSCLYEIQGQIIYSAGTGGVGMNMGWTAPSGVTGAWTSGLQSANFGHTWTGTIVAAQSDASVYSAIITGSIQLPSTGNGVLTFKWASNSGGSMTVGAGSYLVARRIG